MPRLTVRPRRDGDSVGVLLWHHVDDQYATAPAVDVTITVRDLPFDAGRVKVRHLRIDATHSNAYTAWQEMGRPQDLTPEQLAALRSRQGLAGGAPVDIEPHGSGELRARFPLPLHALSLLEIEPV